MEPKNLPNDLKTRKLIWIALLFAIILYNLAAYLVTKSNEPKAIDRIVVVVLSILAAMSGLSAFILKALLNNQALKKLYALPKYTKDIIVWALIESICLFGFVLSILSMDFKYVMYFSIPALVFFIASGPKDNSIINS